MGKNREKRILIWEDSESRGRAGRIGEKSEYLYDQMHCKHVEIPKGQIKDTFKSYIENLNVNTLIV